MQVCLCHDYWWGFSTRNAHMVHTVNLIRLKMVCTCWSKSFFYLIHLVVSMTLDVVWKFKKRLLLRNIHFIHDYLYSTCPWICLNDFICIWLVIFILIQYSVYLICLLFEPVVIFPLNFNHFCLRSLSCHNSAFCILHYFKEMIKKWLKCKLNPKRNVTK